MGLNKTKFPTKLFSNENEAMEWLKHFVNERSNGKRTVHRVVEMIGSMARLDFTERLKTEITNDPIDVLSYGLNMLSEELEHNVVKKSELEEINANLEKFSYTVAHDLKSPLNTISALVSLIEAENARNPNEKIQKYIKLLKETMTAPGIW